MWMKDLSPHFCLVLDRDVEALMVGQGAERKLPRTQWKDTQMALLMRLR